MSRKLTLRNLHLAYLLQKPQRMQHPIVFTKAPQSVIGPGAAIKYPYGWSELVDYEAELAVIIGKPGRGIQKEDPLDHIFGYTILNDVTAREVQKRHQQWFLGRSCDTFCLMGPWIVPASEIDGQDLAIQCWVNDELRQDGRTSEMIFPIVELISTISAGITLQTGDILATGTPAVAAHWTGMHSAIKMLNSRIRILHHHIVSIQKGEAPYDHSLLRQVCNLIRRLLAIDSSRFQDDFLMV
ncbi:unnamed protein product [Sphagnum jensenii]|uniref:Fumarylacetoacetase-like C-terminal domain-containing protein n=1 Tax=Sphagnum jensenii TaxID=128206 RepID=A0ABP1B2F8_9BRYO